LVRVSLPSEEASAITVALEEAVEALNSELGIVTLEGELRAQVGFGRQDVPEAFLGPLRANEICEVPGLGAAYIAQSDLDEPGVGRTGSKGRMVVRWSHPTRGPVPPSSFIPLAEETDTIVELGAHVIGRALAEITALGDGSKGLRLSLNLSARQLADNSLEQVVKRALASSGFPPEQLVLEITESLLIEDPLLARARLDALKRLGLSLAIDDFGTGYSALSYLRQFPVDQVKIDHSFVANLRQDAPDDIAIARSIIELSQRLRVETVAEGIESAEQLDLLTDLGCDLGQGYLIAAPMPAADWLAWREKARPMLTKSATS
jgi:EAL domain-containing protein (putative c-di-GMP-specific phosphodiesterase class I)